MELKASGMKLDWPISRIVTSPGEKLERMAASRSGVSWNPPPRAVASRRPVRKAVSMPDWSGVM